MQEEAKDIMEKDVTNKKLVEKTEERKNQAETVVEKKSVGKVQTKNKALKESQTEKAITNSQVSDSSGKVIFDEPIGCKNLSERFYI